MPESDISGWPTYKDGESFEKPKDEYLASVLNKLTDGSELAGDLTLSTKIVEGVTVKELLEGLEFVHLLTTRCYRCQCPMYVTGWDNFKLRPRPICWECHRDKNWSMKNPHLTDEQRRTLSPNKETDA